MPTAGFYGHGKKSLYRKMADKLEFPSKLKMVKNLEAYSLYLKNGWIPPLEARCLHLKCRRPLSVGKSCVER